jgi:hypothetical protein
MISRRLELGLDQYSSPDDYFLRKPGDRMPNIRPGIQSFIITTADHYHHEDTEAVKFDLLGYNPRPSPTGRNKCTWMSSGCIAEMFRREVRQQSPVLGFR